MINNGVLEKYVGPGGDVVIPDGVTSIGDEAFYDCSLTSVTIPNSVTTIGASAFRGCSSLTSVTIPDSVTSIGSYAFCECNSLTSITIPNGVTRIGWDAFSGCSSLMSVTIPDGVTSIGNGAFFCCNNLMSVAIPDGVTSIGDSAFSRCSSLTSVTIPDSVTSIGDWAFSSCSKLTSLNILGGNVTIGKEMIKDCPALERLTIHHWNPNLKDLPSDDKSIIICAEDKIADIPANRRLQAAIGFALISEKDMTTDWAKSYLDYIKKNATKLINAALRETELLRLMCEYSLIPAKDYDAYLAEAEKIENSEIKAMVLAYKDKLGSAAIEKAAKSKAEVKRSVQKTIPEGVSNPVEALTMKNLTKEKMSLSELKKKVKSIFGLTFDELPTLKSADGAELDKFVTAYLISAQEYEDVLVFGVEKSSEEIVSHLDQASFQSALMALADMSLYKGQRAKKRLLAFPICRYGDENTIAELTKRALTWKTSSSSYFSEPFATFRDAIMMSDTFAAMVFADREHFLDEYAEIRDLTEDAIRDRYLSKSDLDGNREKEYDLGNQKVRVKLNKDLSFSVLLPDGKTAKSLPKKGADPAKYEEAAKDFSRLKKRVKAILKERGKTLFEDFLSGRVREAEDWKCSYLNNPLLLDAASLVVWMQGKSTFTMTENGAIDSYENPYSIGEDDICVAHPIEMEPEDVTRWQKYFVSHGLKQPFAQVWEHVYDPAEIKADRYEGCKILYYRFMNQSKLGIKDYHDDVGFEIKDCSVITERVDWTYRHGISPQDCFEIKAFTFKRYSRRINAVIAYLDRVTVADRVRKDDVSVMDWMQNFSLAQITEFISAAQESQATNVLAALLEYKNEHFADYDPMVEFTLEW